MALFNSNFLRISHYKDNTVADTRVVFSAQKLEVKLLMLNKWTLQPINFLYVIFDGKTVFY